jgi:hypothetical protein
VKLLEGIGAISASDSKKAKSRRGNYQDSVTAPLTKAADDEATAHEGGDEQDDIVLVVDSSNEILTAVDKVSEQVYSRIKTIMSNL